MAPLTFIHAADIHLGRPFTGLRTVPVPSWESSFKMRTMRPGTESYRPRWTGEWIS